MMYWYYATASVFLAAQLIYTVHAYRNWSNARKKQADQYSAYRPSVALIVPCKGLDRRFDENIQSFFQQEYDDYRLLFVVGDSSDPAYERLHYLKQRFDIGKKARQIDILVAGPAKGCSQKNHNLLYCVEKLGDEVEVLAFADSDVRTTRYWLRRLVHPLRKAGNGAATGYRWFIPDRNSLPNLALSSLNAKIAQSLGNTPFNHTWGGSMAIRRRVFKEIGLDRLWRKVLSDDLSLSNEVKKSGRKVAFVPSALVGSAVRTDWAQLFEFGRRQFVITRVYAPRIWWFGLLSTLLSVVGLWGMAAAAVYLVFFAGRSPFFPVAVPVLLAANQAVRAILRQNMAALLLNKDREKLKTAALMDVIGAWVWSLLLLVIIASSVAGRTIRWRGIRYKLLGPTDVLVLDKEP